MRQFQTPERTVFQVGDLVTFKLEVPGAPVGKGFVRTNIGRAAVRRRELIRHTEEGHLLDGLSWRDLEMKNPAPGVFELTISLIEVGVFEAKCFFREDGQEKIRWPEGGNFRIKVETAANVGCNTMYAAFVRQFRVEAPPVSGEKAAVELLDQARYVVIPPSGTFRELIRRLDLIFETLGCRILQLLPIHPTPTSYGRMGRFGSPFASLDYFAVDPALAEFDRHATVLEQFEELIDAVHRRRGRIFLDIPVNHTGWGSKLQNDHPEYFVRDPDGRFESPGAWGTVWEDLCKLNYRDSNVHRLMAEVFLFWSRLGVDGFRCDAGYMLPADAWDYIVSKVREEFPDTVFMLEGLGGKIEVQEHLLGSSGLDWAYSELFQNYSRDEISIYQPYIERCSKAYGTLINFAETHDNARLAAVSPRYAAMRCALTALLSEAGAFGFANGVEFFADEKIDVHGATPLRWGASPNLIAPLRRLHTILGEIPAFYADAKVELVQTGGGNVIAALRSAPGAAPVLAAVNLDCGSNAAVYWEATRFAGDGAAIDLLSGEKMTLRREKHLAGIDLPPGGAALLTFDPALLQKIDDALASPAYEPELVTRQRARAAGYAIWERLAPGTLPDFDVAEVLRRDPMKFCELAAGSDLPNVARYRVGTDERRVFPIVSEELLLLESESVFRAAMSFGGKRLRTVSSIPRRDGKGEFALLTLPRNPEKKRRELTLQLTVFDTPGATRREGTLLELGDNKLVRCRMRVPGDRVRELGSYAFAANCRGGMTLTAAAWGELNSKYDAILAGNGDAACPVDRRTMFTRCRAWLVADAYSHEIDLNTLDAFTRGEDHRARWDFLVPAGQGRLAALRIELAAALDGDAVTLRFSRFADERADADAKFRIILRPDLENRINHELTKAYLGAERSYPAAVRYFGSGFLFAPEPEHALRLALDAGRFIPEPEWQYMVNLPLEEYYGQDHATDLFSPGYFEFELLPDAAPVELFAAIGHADTVPAAGDYQWPDRDEPLPAELGPRDALHAAIRSFIVRRDNFSTVIAGYPWFLDWGRDTLIALRGIIAAGIREESAAILRQFASFEENGTIPNVIHGSHVGNRDTSDAPLWLFVAVRDYIGRFDDPAILDADCRGRSFRTVLGSIIDHYRTGTPNGIRMDQESGLVFSPSHFTWMDTNYPAGTPREGYPIEIQALWYAALEFAGREDRELAELAAKVSHSIEELFFLSELGRFSDCLHGSAATPARYASADDHIRCNQLFAVTLGAIKTREKQLAILESARELLIPGSIRSLADREVTWKLPVWRDGVLLNDPARPYCGQYRGAEDTSRKVAYHNGTAWGWPFPSFCEALYLVGGKAARKRALSLLDSIVSRADRVIPGMLPEITDGDAPHRDGGCPAQAWSVTEAYRVYGLLEHIHK